MELSAKVVIPVASLALFWTWESLQPFFGQPRGRLRHAARNLGLALMNTVIISLGLAAGLAVVSLWADERALGLLAVLDLPPILRAATSFLVLDAAMYLWHRANHRIPLLWRFHRVHHSDIHLDVTTATRFHLGEHVGAYLVRLVLIVALGIRLGDFVLYELVLIVATQFHHADISLGAWDGRLRSLFVTPDMHKTHHSDRRAETDSNYGVVFSWWDRLGRTHVVRSDPRGIRFGLEQWRSERWQSLAGLWRTPFVKSEEGES